MKSLRSCTACHRIEEAAGEACSSCGGKIATIDDPAAIGRALAPVFAARKDRSIWRWFELLPLERRESIVSIGEGGTPLLPGGELGKALDLTRLYVKNDTMLPTGSLKDRSFAVMASKAREDGFETVVVASTGNGAASLSAYAAAAGLRCVVLVPRGTARPKTLQALAYGAVVVEIDSDMRGVGALYREVSATFGWKGCLSDNPHRAEGKKTYAYEMHDQLAGEVPDWVIHPVASGLGIVAMKEGFDDLVSLGWTTRRPKLVAAQAQAASPIVEAFHGREPVHAGPPKSVAEAILVPMLTPLAPHVLEALRASGGTAAAVNDDEILDAQRLLARTLGVFAEPSAAVSVAVARKLRAAGTIGRDDVVVCNVTGTGLKQPEAAARSTDALVTSAPDPSALRAALADRVPIA